MSWLLEMLIYALARPVLQAVLGVFGYDLDWEPKDGRRLTGWRLVFSALLCCAVCGAVAGGAIWLLCVLESGH
jgi:hypothetical protein